MMDEYYPEPVESGSEQATNRPARATRMTEKNPYAGPERRVTSVTEDRVALMIEEAVDEAMTKHEAKMGAMIRNEFNTLQELIKSAFPGGDPHGHRIAHEKAIVSASKWDKLKDGVIEKLLTGGMWAMLLFIALSVWDRIKQEASR